MLAADPRGASIVAFRGKRFESGVGLWRRTAVTRRISKSFRLWQRNGQWRSTCVAAVREPETNFRDLNRMGEACII